MEVTPTLGPKVCKHYLLLAVWISKVSHNLPPTVEFHAERKEFASSMLALPACAMLYSMPCLRAASSSTDIAEPMHHPR